VITASQPQRCRRRGVGSVPEGDRGAQTLGRRLAIAVPRPLRIIRVQWRLGAEPSAIPRPSPRRAARRRPDRPAVGWFERDEPPWLRCCTTSAPPRSSPPAPGYRSTSTPATRTPEQRLRDDREQRSASTTPWSAACLPGAEPAQRIAIAHRAPPRRRLDGLRGDGRPPPTWRPLLPGRGDLAGTVRASASAAA